jgi:phosphoribosylamine--glycine ligase
MNLLVIGGGGREHTLAWALARSPRVQRVFVTPGNGGTAASGDGKLGNAVPDAPGIEGLVELARKLEVELTLVGPEAPLVDGIVDAFADHGLRCFGPGREAARLEGSKAFAKAFMERHQIPTARYRAFSDHAGALAHLSQVDYPVVIKASGLAAGKGVLLPETDEEARAALARLMLEKGLGAAGDEVLIEERLSGQEASVLAFCDGERMAVMPAAQDHKRIFDGDRGPNTGGMGAYVPVPAMTPELLAGVQQRVLRPTLDGLRDEGTPYVGILYAGLMLTDDGPRVLEYNCRFGDPEAQVILPLLDSDLAEVAAACVEGRLNPEMVRWKQGAAATVVAAALGYPGSYEKGLPISGLSRAAAMEGVEVFHAGTRRDDDGSVVTSGGRVLAVTGLADDLPAALSRAYAGIQQIRFDGMHYRQDIGARALG